MALAINPGQRQALRRTMDAARLNAVANDPAVRPYIGGDGPIDLTALLANPENVAFETDGGGFVFAKLEFGRYELHTLFLEGHRGAGVLALFADATRYLFAATDCLEIVTKAPASNKPADFMARRAGFSVLFERDGAWADGSKVTYLSLTLDRWIAQDDALEAEGGGFHDLLAAAKAATGSALPVHPHDAAHERAVGAAVLMLKAGNPQKACFTYSRWARLAGYAPVELLSVSPPLVDVRDAIITLQDAEIEVLLCR